MSAKPQTLGVVVCANGRGHRIRAGRVLAEIRRRHPALCVIQHEEPAVRWSPSAATYDDGRLLAWHERVDALAALRADVVLSDNLAAVLRTRPDAMLMGSFLWSDVLRRAHPTSAPVRAFADAEDALLDRARPTMICLEDFAMPAVRQMANARGVGIIASGPRHEASLSRGPDQCVVFARGGTGAADALIEPLYARMAARGACVWREDVEAIGNAAVVIGRPGIGTITECIEDGVPFVAVLEDNSPEMEHNAARVEALGLGAVLRDAASLDATLADLVGRRTTIARTALTLARDGAERAADIVEMRIQEGKAA